jgi:hypothetical protein
MRRRCPDPCQGLFRRVRSRSDNDRPEEVLNDDDPRCAPGIDRLIWIPRQSVR